MIKDVQLLPLKVNADERGYLIVFASSGRNDVPNIPKIVEVYLVGNVSKGVIRAFHKHGKLWHYIFISHGSAKFVLVDDRKDSTTYKEMDTFVISERTPSLLVVPPGIFHGWMSLEDDTQLISAENDSHKPDDPDKITIPYDSFGDVWSIKFK